MKKLLVPLVTLVPPYVMSKGGRGCVPLRTYIYSILFHSYFFIYLYIEYIPSPLPLRTPASVTSVTSGTKYHTFLERILINRFFKEVLQ